MDSRQIVLDMIAYDDDELPPQRGGDDLNDGPRERLGNNRYHQPKLAAKRRAKLAKASRKRNRK